MNHKILDWLAAITRCGGIAADEIRAELDKIAKGET